MSEVTRLLKKWNGEGKVFAGERFVADVTYQLRVYLTYDEVGTLNGPARTEGIRFTEVSIRPAAAISAFVGQRLTLHMRDGEKQQKQDLLVMSGDGEGIGEGPIYT